MRFSFVVAGLGVIAIARGASAAPEVVPSDRDDARGPFSLGMVGGLIEPMKAMKDSHERGMLAGLRLAWTSSIGLGVEAAIDYSPLPRKETIDGARFDTTYATAAIGPRLAGGWSHLRFALAAGGGLAVDHTTEALPLVDPTSSTTIVPAAEVGVEIEVPVVTGGGFLVTGGGTRAFGTLAYEYAWAMGGLALNF